MKEDKVLVLDGSPEDQDKIVKNFLGSLTKEECERAMSHEFDYLEDDED